MENSSSSKGREAHLSAKEMWFSFTKDDLRQGTSDSEEELFYSQRITTCARMAAIGKHLEMQQQVIATSIVYFHRFYALNKFIHHDKFVMATTCMFLGSKAQESFRSLEHVIRASHKEFYKTDIHPNSESYSKLKNAVLKCEMSLLQTLGFDFSVELPYSHLVKMYRSWKATAVDVKESSADEKELIQVSWNFLNDSFKIPLCLQYKPVVIAAGMLAMASNFIKKFSDFPFHQYAKPEVLKSIEEQMKGLYEVEKKNAEKKAQTQQQGNPQKQNTGPQPQDSTSKPGPSSQTQNAHPYSGAPKSQAPQSSQAHPYQSAQQNQNSSNIAESNSNSSNGNGHPYQTSNHVISQVNPVPGSNPPAS